MKKIFISLFVLLAFVNVFAQSDDDFFSDDNFFSDDSFFMDDSLSGDDAFFSSDDDMFFDDGIEEYREPTNKTDLSKGIIFEDGSVKIGGSFSTSVGLSTILYNEKLDDFSENLKNTTLTPSASANISLDARPNQNLRMFTKFNVAYPFKTEEIPVSFTSTEISDFLKVNELFTDFSIADTAYFRFGLHTVTWGTGLFYSPVSDMINTSSIDPENTDLQVDGSLNLRTLITLPHSMNSLWFYMIPDFETKLARDTAFAGKYEFLLGDWELGVGGFYKYNVAPKAMITASGSIKKLGLFGEAVYQYGSNREWIENQSFDNKKSIIKATAGFNYMWKDPSITLVGQYYYDGNDFAIENIGDIGFYLLHMDLLTDFASKGHNVSALVNFGELFNNDDLSLSLLGIVQFKKPNIMDINSVIPIIESYYPGSSEIVTSTVEAIKQTPIAIFNATLSYKPTDTVTISGGPYVTVTNWKDNPSVAFKINFSLGGGNF